MNKQALQIAAILGLGVAAVLWALHRSATFTRLPEVVPPAPSRPAPTPGPSPSAENVFASGDMKRIEAITNTSRLVVPPELLARFLAVEQERARLDETVWAPEALAQRYEDTFISLWDEMRNGGDAWKPLEQFGFEELSIPTPQPATRHDWNVEHRRFDGPGRRLDPPAWRQLLAGFQREGYRLDDTEWRNPEFELDPNGQAHSVILLTAHALNTNTQHRVILKARLNVTWKKAPDGGGLAVAGRIQATDVELTEHSGPAPFREVLTQTLEPRTNSVFVDPVILYDLDRDGFSEIILGCKNLVFWNKGNGRLLRSTLCRHVPEINYTSLIADFDGDGLADYLCADLMGLWLYNGDRQGRFPNPPRRVWRADPMMHNPFVMTTGDANGDGHLDVWIGQYKVPYEAGQMPCPYYDANDGFPAFFLLNDGQGGFRDATEAAGLASKRFRRSYSASFIDLDADGDLDLLVVSDFFGVDLFRNNGKGQFTHITASAVDEPHALGMSHAFGDFNLDGELDFIMIGMNSYAASRMDHLMLGPKEFPNYQAMRPIATYGNRLYLGQGGVFRQGPLSEQVARTGWSWGVTAGDFDNDADDDLYIANGQVSRKSAKDYETQFWRHDIYAATSQHDPVLELYFKSVNRRLFGEGRSYGGHENNVLFMNEAGKSFLEVGYLMDVALAQDIRNVVWEDLDGDGRMDLVAGGFAKWPIMKWELHLLQNQLETGNNWIGFHLREAGPGFSPVGSRVTITTKAGRSTRHIVTGDSFRSQHSPTAHFGLGHLTEVEAVEVRWSNGRVKRIEHPAINHYHLMMP